ncbi:MAG: hypothetical protein JOS17DRAFT_40366 [Linnemannia elongata]|nr:MAG: hypothetical protein JOS17DRAFT_40366 [Linnemannia elongata]
MLNTHATCLSAHDQAPSSVSHPSTITTSLLYFGSPFFFLFVLFISSFPLRSFIPFSLPPHTKKKKQHHIHVCFPFSHPYFFLCSPSRLSACTSFLTPRFLFVALFYPSNACKSLFFFFLSRSSLSLLGHFTLHPHVSQLRMQWTYFIFTFLGV